MRLFFYLLLVSFSFNAEILLIDGTKLIGEITSSSDKVISVRLDYNSEIMNIDRNNILNIDFNSSSFNVNESGKNVRKDIYSKTFLYSAGKDLQSFRSQYYIGFGMQSIGFMMLASADDRDEIQLPFILIVVGGLVQLFSFSKIGQAGEKLEAEASVMD